MLFLLYLGLEGITVTDTDPKGRFVCFNYDMSFAKDPGYTGSILISILIKNC